MVGSDVGRGIAVGKTIMVGNAFSDWQAVRNRITKNRMVRYSDDMIHPSKLLILAGSLSHVGSLIYRTDVLPMKFF